MAVEQNDFGAPVLAPSWKVVQLVTVLTAGVLQEVVAAPAQLPQVAVLVAEAVMVLVMVEVLVITPQKEVAAGVLVVQLEVTG